MINNPMGEPELSFRLNISHGRGISCDDGSSACRFCFSSRASATSQDAVRLDLVTYKQLGNEIKKLQGKVVLVDFWADFCRPCKEKFPHVLALHRKYAKDGLAVVSVSIDDVADPDVRERVKLFLQQQSSTCKNLLLAEKPEVWVAETENEQRAEHVPLRSRRPTDQSLDGRRNQFGIDRETYCRSVG